MLRFISLNTYKIVFSVGGHNTIISSVSVSPSGKHIAMVLDSGSCQVTVQFTAVLSIHCHCYLVESFAQLYQVFSRRQAVTFIMLPGSEY